MVTKFLKKGSNLEVWSLKNLKRAVKMYQQENTANEGTETDFYPTADGEDSDDGGYYSTIEDQNFDEKTEDLDFGNKKKSKDVEVPKVTKSEFMHNTNLDFKVNTPPRGTQSEFGLGPQFDDMGGFE